jgi:hypothetical protein
LKIKTKIVSCHTADSKPVKQEVNSAVIFPPLVFPGHNIGDKEKHYYVKLAPGLHPNGHQAGAGSI